MSAANAEGVSCYHNMGKNTEAVYFWKIDHGLPHDNRNVVPYHLKHPQAVATVFHERGYIGTFSVVSLWSNQFWLLNMLTFGQQTKIWLQILSWPHTTIILSLGGRWRQLFLGEVLVSYKHLFSSILFFELRWLSSSLNHFCFHFSNNYHDRYILTTRGSGCETTGLFLLSE